MTFTDPPSASHSHRWAVTPVGIALLMLCLGGGAGCRTAVVPLFGPDEEPRAVFQQLAGLEVRSDRLYRAITEQADVVGYSRQLEVVSDLAGPLTSFDMERIAPAFHGSLKVMLFDLAPPQFWERHLASYYAATLSEGEAQTFVDRYEAETLVPLSRLEELRRGFVADRVRELLPEVRARSYTFTMRSTAMAPTVLPGDHVIVNQAAYGAALPQRGDVILFRFPDEHGPLMIYRVIAVPGDQVQVREQRVSVNGEVLREPYVQHMDHTILEGTVRDHLGPVTVPPDRYFVMGDNREWSLDSRFLGPISLETVVGQVLFIYWSVDPDTRTPRWDHFNQPVR